MLNFPGATGAGLGLNQVAAGKTGTANNSEYAAFGGYTPNLAAYVSVFHPTDPGHNLMVAPVNSCYQQQGGALACNGEMFGADAPGHTWQLSFERANLGSAAGFVPVPGDSPLMSMGDGQSAPQQGGKGKGKNGGGGNGNGGNGNGGNGNANWNGGGDNGGGGNGGGENGGGGNGGGGNGGGGNGGGGTAAAEVTAAAEITAAAAR